MLTLTLRYFFGSFLICGDQRAHVDDRTFMFSYNCLSFSN